MKVYLDNVIVSGIVRGDLDPPKEMAAVRALVKADEKGQIEIYTSRWSWAEQDRTRDDFLRVKLKESRGEIEVVADDHREVPRIAVRKPGLLEVGKQAFVDDIDDHGVR